MGEITHDRLYRTVKMDLRIVARSPLRIGSGLRDPRYEGALLRVEMLDEGREVPYIPGSSLKGVLRSTAEGLANSVRDATGGRIWACDPLGRDSCDRRLRRDLKRAKSRGDKISIVNRQCTACRTFGSLVFRSPTSVSDFYPTYDGQEWSYRTAWKAGVALGREGGGVVEGRLYEVEYVSPGSRFDGTITMENLPNYLMGLISASILALSSGAVRVGAMKSRGFGEVSVEVARVTVTALEGGALRELSPPLDLQPFEEGDVAVSVGSVERALEDMAGAWWSYVRSLER